MCLQERALRSLAEDEVLQEAVELARQMHGNGSHHGIAWEAALLQELNPWKLPANLKSKCLAGSAFDSRAWHAGRLRLLRQSSRQPCSPLQETCTEMLWTHRKSHSKDHSSGVLTRYGQWTTSRLTTAPRDSCFI